MLALFLQISQCERKFYLYILDNRLKFASEEEEDRAQTTFCESFEKGGEGRALGGKLAAPSVNNPPINEVVRLKEDEAASPEGKNITTYNRLMESDITSCSVESYKAHTGNITGMEEMQGILKIDGALPTEWFLGEYGLLHKAQDQGTCGSCYAFTARLIFESLMKWNAPYYSELQSESNTIFNTFKDVFNDYSQLLSVQYILNNTDEQGGNSFCAGGNYEYVAEEFLMDWNSTEELNVNFPYQVMMNKEVKLEDKATNITPEIANTSYVNPFYWYKVDVKCPLGQFEIDADSYKKGWSDKEVAVIKMFLAHGVPLAGQMHFNGSGTKDTMMAFQNYKDGYVAGKCVEETANHQVTLVGYGTYKGVPVWVFENSWGAAWGEHGFYYVRIGSNAMCHEVSVIATLPRYFGYNEDDKNKAFLNSNHYEVNKDFFENSFSKEIRRGYNGLDFDNGTYFETKITWQGAIMIVVLILFSLFVLYHLLVSECCPPPLAFKPTIYVLMTPEEGSTINWDEDCTRVSA